MLSFPLFYGSSRGRDFFSNLVSNSLEDSQLKGAIAIVMLAIPVLIAGTICSLLGLTRSTVWIPKNRWAASKNLPVCVHRLYQRLTAGNGDRNFDLYSVLFILLPGIIFTASSIYRHLRHRRIDLAESLKEVGNSFGMVALIALSFFLVPVSRHGPILKVLGWNPARAVRLHIWCGRVIVIGSLVHGIMHMFRWKYTGEGIWSVLLPPSSCWTLGANNGVELHCANEETECSCYAHFRNLTGFVAGLGLVVIFATSLNVVRRRFYRLFYMSHVLAAPIVLFGIIFHYNRAILYISPSLIYYVATSLPTIMESRRKCQLGVKILSVERISASLQVGKPQRPCISLTIEASDAAIQQYGSGYYVKLTAPVISTLSHPFTINKVPGKSRQLRIIFRVMGTFTNQLAKHLCSGDKLPLLHVDGYHGASDRVSQVLQHDVAVFLAGGIGITPYLTLLEEVSSILSSQQASSTSPRYPTKKIVLHWICRDFGLVDYVCREYIEPLLASRAGFQIQIQIVVHRTGIICGQSEINAVTSYSDIPHSNVSTEMVWEDGNVGSGTTQDSSAVSPGFPFTPSRFATGTRSTISSNCLPFVAFTTIAWSGLALTWYIYSNVQQEEQVLQRAYAPIAILLLGALVSRIANVLPISFSEQPHKKQAARHCDRKWWAAIAFGGDEEVVEKGSCEKKPLSLKMSSLESYASLSSDEENQDVKRMTMKTDGRPTVGELLDSVDAAQYPGIFCCGPTALSQEIHRAAEERCVLRAQQRDPGSSFIAVYDEAFLM
jgi:predicted ferric reductase